MLSPPLAGRPGLSTQLSDEDVSVTGTLGEDQLVFWTPLIKLWSCHGHAATAAASCYLCPLSSSAQAHSTAWGGGGMVNEERAALLKQMPVPPRGKRNTPLCLQEMLAHGPGVLAFPVTYRVTRHLLKPLTGGQSQGLWFRLQCSCPLVHPIRDQ